MRIWHMEPYACGDRRLPHHVFPPKTLTADQLHTLTGVVYYKVDIDDPNALKKRLSKVKTERNVSSSDIFQINSSFPDFEQKLEELYEPVVKDEDSVYLIMEGSAYYDVEKEEDDWIRINVEKGDLLVIPKGLPYRFTVTPKNYVLVERFFHSDRAPLQDAHG
uniref:1,2-dihydroxy-3-keto-5-methylthiopentene dioxygenase n=1 Tax=Ascaris suum TaxID=6253 RepID=F1LDG9_ASCSU